MIVQVKQCPTIEMQKACAAIVGRLNAENAQDLSHHEVQRCTEHCASPIWVNHWLQLLIGGAYIAGMPPLPR